MYDAVVIGAGVTGGMIARELVKKGVKVCIVERENDVARGSTKANSAIVHAGFDAAPGSLKARLNVLGSKMMEQITRELDVKYINNGSLVIAFNEEDERVIGVLYDQGIENGVEGLEIADKKRLKELEPNISDNATGALYAPTGAIVCPYQLTIALIGNAMDNGADLRCNFKVSDIKIEDGIYTVASEDGKEVKAKYVINCAGLYADEIANMVGDKSFKIHPRRGEYILLDKECGKTVSHTIFRTPSKMGKGILISPTVDGNLITGPTSVDMEDKENKDTTSGGFDSIIKEAKENVENINFGKSITSFCGLRAAGDTGDFIINSPREGFVNAGGIESPGLSASPAIAMYVLDILKDMGLELKDNPTFNPYRKSPEFFRKAPLEEKNEIIKREPAFGRIICRCEGVTEGEILYALRQNPKPCDLDGIKFRTRAQMGRCQGGFCSPAIMEILSKELGIPFNEVTKNGGESLLNVSVTKGEF